MKIRVLIVDDEALARSRVRQFLRHEKDVEVIAECANGREAVEAVRQEKPDVVFLDVQMPGLNGFDVCGKLAEAGGVPLVIFTTAYDQYALKAFEVHAIDYLLKPFDRERFARALDHARDQLQRRDAGDIGGRLAGLLEDLRPGFKKPDRLVLKEDGRIVFVRAGEIDWIEADGNYVRIHAGAASHYVRETLGALEAELPGGMFMRVSRSSIVNLDRIKEIQPLFYGDHVVLLQNGAKVTLSRNYREKLESLLARRA